MSPLFCMIARRVRARADCSPIARGIAVAVIVLTTALALAQEPPGLPLPEPAPPMLGLHDIGESIPLEAEAPVPGAPRPAVPPSGVSPSNPPIGPPYSQLGLPAPCTREILPPNPHLPDSLLPDPLLPAPALIPQGVCDGPFGCEGPAAACPPEPRWLFRGGAVFLNRSDAFNQPLIALPSAGQLQGEEQPVQFAAGDFQFDLQAGPEIDLMFLSPRGWQAQLRYFGVASWNADLDLTEATTSHVGRLLFDGAGQSVLVENPRLDYNSDLHSTELNFRRPVNPWMTTIFGFRWIEMEEWYGAAATERPPSDTAIRPSYLDYETTSRMYGVQLGADIRILDRGKPFRLDSSFTAGLYLSESDLRATRESFTVDSVDGDIEISDISYRSLSDEDGHVSFHSEMKLGASWQVGRHLALRGGWQLLWIEGVALAPEQLATTALGDSRVEGSPAAADVDTDGGAFYHGPYLTIEAVW